MANGHHLENKLQYLQKSLADFNQILPGDSDAY